MKIKNNIILKNNRNMLSGTGMHKHGLMVDLRDYLRNGQHENIVVNNPTYGRILGNKAGADNVKIGDINDASSTHDDIHSSLVDKFQKISFKDKKKKGIRFEI